MMDITRGNALITAGASIVAAVIAAAMAFYLDMLRRRAEAKAKDEAEKAERLRQENVALGKAAGYSVERIEFSETFDETGSGQTVLDWYGIRSRGQDIQDLKIDYHSDVAASPGSRIGPWDLQILNNSVATFRFVEDTAKKTQRSVTGLIILKNFILTPTTGFVGYRMVQHMTNQHLMRRAAVEKAYANDKWKSEYLCYPVPTPDADELVVRIDFPPSHHQLTPVPRPVAFESGTEDLNVNETTRLEGGVDYTNGVARLVVPKPKRGLRYGISWESPI